MDGGGKAKDASYKKKVRVENKIPKETLIGTVIIHAILFTIMRFSKQ